MKSTLPNTLALAIAFVLTTTPFLAPVGAHDHTNRSPADAEPADVDAWAEADVPANVDVSAEVEEPVLTGDEAVIAAQLPTYPLSVCPASGEELGEMGEPVNHVHEGRLVRFCCSGCLDEFNENPAVYLEKIDAAVIEAQLATYPVGECPVSGRELGTMGDPYNHVYGTRLVRFCCGGCVDTFTKDPATYIARVDDAAAAEEN